MSPPSTPRSITTCAFFIVGAIITMRVAMGTTHWAEVDVEKFTIFFGLFEVCIPDECLEYDDLFSYSLPQIAEVRGMCITAVVLYTLTLVIIFHLVFIQKLLVQSKYHGYTCWGIGLTAATFAWIGVGNFVTGVSFHNGDQWNYGYSIYLASISGVFIILAGTCAAIGVGRLFNSQHNPGLLIQKGIHQPIPGVVNPGADYVHLVYPQKPCPNTDGVEPQPTVEANPDQVYVVTERHPSH